MHVFAWVYEALPEDLRWLCVRECVLKLKKKVYCGCVCARCLCFLSCHGQLIR